MDGGIRLAKPSTKMLRALRSIQEVLGVKFEGSKDSFDDVKNFLDQYMESWKKALDESEPSEKQLNGIALIERKLGITFTGQKNRKEVSEFLNEHLKKALETKSDTPAPKSTATEPPDPFDT